VKREWNQAWRKWEERGKKRKGNWKKRGWEESERKEREESG